MGTFSPTHWFIVLVMITPLMALLVVPTWRILQRAGFNGAWALLMLVPVVGLLVPWVVSFLKWPSDREARTSTSKGGVIAGLVLLPLAVGVLALMVNAANGSAPNWENGQLSSPAQGTSHKDQFGGELVAPAK
jgi:predicted lysophospholipase L1 biosynthesis ABC-type transport system permease subunit